MVSTTPRKTLTKGILLSLLIIAALFLAVREVALRNLDPEAEKLRPVYRAMNAHQYRLYSVDEYKIYLNISESPMMYARATGTYEPHMMDSIRSRIEPGMTFIDVGANKGDHAFLVGQLTGDNGKVIAVEPLPDNHHWLKKSLAKNDFDNIELVEAALSDEDGQATFEHGEFSGWGKMLADDGEAEKETIQVRKAALDSLVSELDLEQVDAIKIDVEGAETEVVRGARKTIERFRPMIWLEIHAGRADVDWLSDFFTEQDYRITRLSTGEELSRLEDTGDRVLLTPR